MKFIRFICLLLCFSSMSKVAFGKEDDFQKAKLVDQVTEAVCFDANDHISRKDALVAIMRIIGLDANTVYTTAHYCLIEKNIFTDADYFHNEEYSVVYYAGVYGIAKGVNETGNSIFQPERAITQKEVCAFILRCTDGTESVRWDNIEENSIQSGILDGINYSETTWNEPCNKEVFKKLLHNFLNKKRYLYWTKGETDDGMVTGRVVVDNDNLLNYYDWYTSLSNIDKAFFSKNECPNCKEPFEDEPFGSH